jgi:26S proteasome regulatory subunit N1
VLDSALRAAFWFVLAGVALAGLLAVLYACQDMKATLGAKHHHIIYCLATAMKPRMLLTVDEEGTLLPVPVRVGQAVDVVAQAGRPKTITGFQTHTTPVLMGVGERAELVNEKYIPLSPMLEGTVILKKNPDFMEEME